MIIAPHPPDTSTTSEPVLPPYNFPVYPRQQPNPFLQSNSSLTQPWYYGTTPHSCPGPTHPTSLIQLQESHQSYLIGPPFSSNANVNLKKTPYQHLVVTGRIGPSLNLYGNK